MKIRQGFVSNSSSSSFVIKTKENQETAIPLLKKMRAEYYIHNGIMYTSYIDDGEPDYSKLEFLSDDDYNGERGGTPFNSGEFIRIKDTEVYLPIEVLTEEEIEEFDQVSISTMRNICNFLKAERDNENIDYEEVVLTCFSMLSED